MPLSLHKISAALSGLTRIWWLQNLVLEFPDEYTLKLPGKESKDPKREFQFDYCFPGDSSQEDVFKEARSVAP